MKVSREQAVLNRERIVDVAAKLFRERGYDGIGVADLMKNAGLTHGGFYGHFGSKEELMAEACERALQSSVDGFRKKIDAAASPERALAHIATSYLSAEHRDAPGGGCTVAALGADVARLAPQVRQMLSKGMQDQLLLLAGLMPAAADEAKPAQDAQPGASAPGAEARRQAIVTYATMVGALVMARAVDDTALSDEILQTVLASLRPAA